MSNWCRERFSFASPCQRGRLRHAHAPRGVLVRQMAALQLLCSIDQGTTSTRVILYDSTTLAPVAAHQEEHRQIMPQAGCVLPTAGVVPGSHAHSPLAAGWSTTPMRLWTE